MNWTRRRCIVLCRRRLPFSFSRTVSLGGLKRLRYTFAGNNLTIKLKDGKEWKITFTLDPTKKPKTLDPKPNTLDPSLEFTDEGHTMILLKRTPRQVKAEVPATNRLAGRTEKTDDTGKLQGIWTGAITEVSGIGVDQMRLPGGDVADKDVFRVQVLIKGEKLILRGPYFLLGTVGFGSRVDNKFMFEVDEAKKPKWIDLEIPPADDDVRPLEALGLYNLDGDTLIVCLSSANKKRPELPNPKLSVSPK